MTGQSRLGPTHVCPRCGEWWDVERERNETWLVTAHDNGASLAVKVWAEESIAPVCPVDTCTLDTFNIVLT